MNAAHINKAVLRSFNTVNTGSLSLLGKKKKKNSMFKNIHLAPTKSSVKPTVGLETTRQSVLEDGRL